MCASWHLIILTGFLFGAALTGMYYKVMYGPFK
jgi:hypothetical protein